MQKKIRKYWDERAKILGEFPSATGWGGHLRKIEVIEVRRALPAEGSILDLGCGNGYVIEQIISESRNLIGIDLSHDMIRVAKKRLEKNSDLIEGNAVSLPFKDCCFDYVYSIRTLIFVPKREKEKAIAEAIRVLKTGGLLMLIECSVEGIDNLNVFRRLLGIPDLPAHRHLFFEEEGLESMLKRNHVEILRKTYFPLVALLEKVFYPKVKRIRGATRLCSVACSLIYYVDRSLCGLFPVLGYDILYVCKKAVACF